MGKWVNKYVVKRGAKVVFFIGLASGLQGKNVNFQ